MAEKFYSSRLINYVERVDVAGFAKTAFYTEINTNLKPGDRVFIQNGNYDSDDFIDQDRYAKYVDGYRVISVDRCKIVLDIDYVGLKPYQVDNIDNFIKVWNVKDERDLRYFDQILIDSYSDRRYSKFQYQSTNNIIYSAKKFINIERPDATLFSLNNTDSFWAKNTNGSYKFINYDVVNNTFGLTSGSYFGTGYFNAGFSNNGRLFIYGEDFKFQNKVYKQRNIYKFQDGEWVIDTKFKPAIISKLNFRDGRFKGNHFDGVWGTYQKSLDWTGTFSNWQSGVFVNSNWMSGNLNSKSTIASQSYYSALTETGLPVQTSDFSNNKGQGYNYVLDSNVYNGTISDGNFINCNVGLTISSTVSCIDDYYSNTDSYKLVAKGGFYNFCDIFDSKITDATILDSRVYNSNLTQTRLLNSQFYDVVASGEYNAENGIKVLSADIYSYIPGLVPGNPEPDFNKIRGVLKLYISESDLMRLDSFDNFYITKINKNLVLGSLSSDQKVILPYETKYILDSFYNSDFSNLPLQTSIKMSSDNKYKPFVTTFNSNYYNTFQLSGVTYSSIDLDLGEILAHYYQGVAGGGLTASNPTYIKPETERVINQTNVNGLFSNTVLKNADFVSGILQNTNWLSGAMINRQSNIIKSFPNSRPAITYDSVANTLTLQLPSVVSYLDNTLKVGKNIWLDSIYNDPGVKPRIDVEFGNWSVSAQLAQNEGCTFSTPLGTFSFVVPQGTSYGAITDDFINQVVVPILRTNALDNYYRFSSVSTPTKAIFRMESKTTDSVFNITSAVGLPGSNMNFSNNVSSSPFRGYNLSGRYKITNLNDSGGIKYLTIQSQDNSQIYNSDQFFFDTEVNPNFISINQAFIKDSNIFSGLFKRSLITNSTFYNESFNNQDRDISVSNVDLLRITKTIFKNNHNDIKSGLFYRDHFFGGTWSSGVAYEVIWQDSIFNSGVFKAGYWRNGTFSSGKFVDSLGTSYGAVSFSSPTEVQSWRNGTFEGGEFDNSVWRDGNFMNGKFFNSLWYTGNWFNGILGDANIPAEKTTIAKFVPTYDLYASTRTYWYDGVVENATLGGDGALNWFGGKFNRGLFTSNGAGPVSGSIFSRESIWGNGEFNGGEFAGLARWNSGKFNNGYFNSYYGWTMSNATSSEFYSWQNGQFNGGKFGNAGYATNSTWFYGQFNDGIFQGRVWNDGNFNKGNFNGGSTYSARSYETNFVNSFTNSFYGLWRNGNVIDVKTNLPSDEKIVTPIQRVNEIKKINVDVSFKNCLWLDGYFSSNSAIFENSAWLRGQFMTGKFKDSIFNPYVSRRPFYGLTDSYGSAVPSGQSFDKNTDLTYWSNGEFLSGNFYFSEWRAGVFQNGTMSGAIWKNGTWNYGDANNVYWENGLWRNGNWDGAPWDYEELSSNKANDLMIRVAQYVTSSNVFVNNALTGTVGTEQVNNPTFSGSSITATFSRTTQTPGAIVLGSGWSYSNSYLDGNVIIPDSNIYVDIDTSQVGSGVATPASAEFNVSDDGGDWVLPSNHTITWGVYTFTIYGSFTVYTSPLELYTYDILYSYNESANATVKSNYDIVYTGDSGGACRFKLVAKLGGPTYNFTSLNISSGYPLMSVYSVVNGLTAEQNQFNYSNSIPIIIRSIAGTTSIFTSPVYYSIEIDYRVESETGGGAQIEVWTGPKLAYQAWSFGVSTQSSNSTTYSTIRTAWQPTAAELSTNYLPVVETVLFIGYLTQYSPLQKTLRIRAKSIFGIPNKATVRILRVSVKPYSNIAMSIYNNRTLQPWGVGIPTYSSIFNITSSPYNIVPTFIVNNNLVSVKYGNGTFLQGIWENGVWNNGNRDDSTKREFRFITANSFSINTSSISLYSNVWTVTLETKDSTQISGLKVGDSVILSNIIGYDSNNKRRLIKSTFVIESITPKVYTFSTQYTVTLSAKIETQLRYITIDSGSHLVYLSKSIWKSGVFLNGYFNGIWQYGLIKSTPNLALIENTHIVDGVFDGGKFSGTQGVYTNFSNNLQFNYNKPLVQNFIFRDNNKSTKAGEYSFDSWIDVNYNTNTMVNIYSEKKYFDDTFELEIPEMNLNGFPTFDILSSNSTFRSSDANQSISYSLGSKFQIYNDFLVPTAPVSKSSKNLRLSSSNVQFNKPFDSTIKFRKGFINNTILTVTYSSPGMTNFFIDGWTYSAYDYVFIPDNYQTMTNVGFSSSIPTPYIYKSNILGTQSSIGPSLLINGPKTGAKNINILNNTNVDIEPNRYTIIDFNLDLYQGLPTYSETKLVIVGTTTINIPGQGPIEVQLVDVQTTTLPAIYLFNKPSIYSNNQKVTNHILTPGSNKIEYFYNRTDLNMSFWSKGPSTGVVSYSGTWSFGTAAFSKIKMYEVDSIPFFQYFTNSNIDLSIRAPYKATAPFIDYTKNNVSFIDSVSVSIETVPTITTGVGVEDDLIFVPIAQGVQLTVICTELNNQGYLSDDILVADEQFGQIIRQTDPVVMLGYHIWAKPIVDQMKKSKVFTKVVWSIAKPWAMQMAYEMGAANKSNLFGKLLMKFGIWMSRKVGQNHLRTNPDAISQYL